QMSDPNAGLPPRYLRTPEAARFLGLSGRTLEKHRTYGTGPIYRKLGGRVVYAVDGLKAWVDRGAKESTSHPGAVGGWPPKRVAPIPYAGKERRGFMSDSKASAHRRRSERDQLDLFRALPGDLAPRDAQDLMAYPFFSLAKSKRIVPIDIHVETVSIRVE